MKRETRLPADEIGHAHDEGLGEQRRVSADEATCAGHKPADDQMKGHVIRGIIQVGLASVFMRGGGLIAQIVSGYILTQGDFGLFAITLGFSTFSVATLSALRPLFIERITKGEEPDRLWRLILYLMIGIAAFMIVGSNLIAGSDSRMPSLLIAIAPTLPLQFSMVIGIGRLAADLRFGESSKILTISSMSRHSALIVFALLGFGAYSLVLPLYVETLVEGTMLWRATGRPHHCSARSAASWVSMDAPSWLMLAAVALGFSLSGDYVAISPFETKEVVGLYFFGYSLSAALTAPFTMAATNVLVPSFASVKSPDRLRSSYLDAVSLLLLVTGMAFGGLALVGGTIVDFIWSGTWNDAIVAMVLISAGTPFRILQPTCYSLLQAKGLWSTQSLLASFNAVFAVGGAIIGAMIGGLLEISLMVGIAGGLVGTTVAVIAGTKIGIKPAATAASLVRGATPPVAGAIAAYALYPVFLPPLGGSIIRAVVFCVVSVPLTFVLFQHTIRSTITSARSR
ncbi:MAG: oligosaccharide flippase family protein [Acidimicrobiales bacterium]